MTLIINLDKQILTGKASVKQIRQHGLVKASILDNQQEVSD